MEGVVTVTIESAGKPIPPEYEVLSVDTIKAVNKIPLAELVLIEGKTPEEPFSITDSDFFKPGQECEIKLRYEKQADKELTVFAGIIIKNKIVKNRRGALLTVSLKGHAFKMTRIRKSRLFAKKNDKKIIETILADYGSDFSKKMVDDIAYPHKQMIQYNCTDWDFMLSRAETNAMWIIADDKSIALTTPTSLVAKALAHTFDIANTDAEIQINEFEMEADISHDVAAIQAQYWESDEIKLSSAIKADDFKLEQGKQSSLPNDALVKGDYEIFYPTNLEKDELKNWLSARLQKARLSTLRGRIQIDGRADILLGQKIKLVGISKQVNGETLISAVRHQVNTDGWQTQIQFGIRADWFTDTNAIMAAPAAGILPAVSGLQLAIVSDYKKDSEQPNKVKIKLPVLGAKENEVWARLSSIYASKEKGVVFRPEPGDEVIVGFLNEDPREPVILGSLHNKKNPPPIEFSDKNQEKCIVTNEEIKLLIDEKAKILKIQVTPDNEIAVMADSDAGISIKDKNKNEFNLSKAGLAITIDKDIAVKSKANITFEGSKIESK